MRLPFAKLVLFGATLLDFLGCSSADSGSSNNEGPRPGDGDEGSTQVAAIFAGSWQGGGEDGGSADFDVSTGDRGLHAYAEVASDRATVVVMLANIPGGVGWLLTGICAANSAKSTICDLSSSPMFMGSYFPTGVSEASDGALVFAAAAPANLPAAGPDPLSNGHVLFSYDSIASGNAVTVSVQAVSEKGHSIIGQLQGDLYSTSGATITFESCGQTCARGKEVRTGQRP
jgi:hypothetical protein